MRASARVENAIGLTPEVCEIEFRIEAGGTEVTIGTCMSPVNTSTEIEHLS